MIAIFPLAGSGERFRRAGYDRWKPLIPVDGVPMLARSAECLQFWRPDIVVPVFHPTQPTADRDAARSILADVFPAAEIRVAITASPNRGAADTVLDGTGVIGHEDWGHVISIDCDRASNTISMHGIYGTAGMFVRDLVDGESETALSWAIGRSRDVGSDDQTQRFGQGKHGSAVIEVIEKPESAGTMRVIMSAGRALPSAGVYWWPSVEVYRAAAARAACGCGCTDSNRKLPERYVAPILNATAKIGIPIAARYVTGFRSFGTPEDLTR